jgi:hypothetical protein
MTEREHMNRYGLPALLADLTIALAAFLAVVLIFSGCATTPYKTLRTVAVSVDAARAYYADQIVAGKVSEERQAKIDAAVVKYQAAMNVAIAAARMDLKAPAPADVQRLASEVIVLVQQLK